MVFNGARRKKRGVGNDEDEDEDNEDNEDNDDDDDDESECRQNKHAAKGRVDASQVFSRERHGYIDDTSANKSS